MTIYSQSSFIVTLTETSGGGRLSTVTTGNNKQLPLNNWEMFDSPNRRLHKCKFCLRELCWFYRFHFCVSAQLPLTNSLPFERKSRPCDKTRRICKSTAVQDV